MLLLFLQILAMIIAARARLDNNRQAIFNTSDIKVEYQMNMYSEGSVYVTCLNSLWIEIPNVQLSPDVRHIIFRNCSFPATVNISNIFNSTKIDHFKKISYTWVLCTLHRQNLQDLTAQDVYFIGSNITEITFDLLYDVHSVSGLHISDDPFQRIPEAFFSNWTEDISEVDMDSNALRKIARNDLRRLVNVNQIILSGNAIETIEPGAFDGLINLKTLDLGLNPLQTLPPGIFDQTTNLTEINLSDICLDDLPRDLLKNTKNLVMFTMTLNKGNLRTLPSGLFKNLRNLKTIVLKNDELERLPSDVFVGCSVLDHINLSGNKLTTLPSGLLDDMENLSILDLSYNHIETLPAFIFKGLKSLEKLIIFRNRLTSLTLENLKGLQSLDILDIGQNKLTQIDDRLILQLKSATYIDFSDNQLNFINTENQKIEQCDLDASVKPKLISLSGNKLTKLNAELIKILRYITDVNLSSNRISTINVTELSSGLDICNVNKTKGAGVVYVKINLADNQMHCDCSMVHFLDYLSRHDKNKAYHLYADDENADDDDPDTFGKGFICASPPDFKEREARDIRVEELSCLLKSNTLSDACNGTCVCQEYPGKQFLSVDCSHKNLTRLPSVIENAQNYWSIGLNMSGNMLQNSPPMTVSYAENITFLDLSNNDISKVTIDLFTPKLQHLNLHGNSISRLDSSITEHLISSNNTLGRLTLHDNKWNCDCEARELVELVHKEIMRYNFSQMSCYETNRTLYEMSPSELCEDAISVEVVASLSLTVLGIVLASFLAVYYKYQREIKFWLYSKHWCLWFVTEDELDEDKEYDAFISFSHKDEDFVEKEIIAKLEGGPRPYKLCLHYRDWFAGEWIPAQINRSVAESRRTIVVLTPNFLESVWGLIEFRTAHIQALKDGRARLIVIIFGEIGKIDDLDQEMQDYLRLNTYIKWGDPWFWNKLKYALPHAKKPMRKSRNSNIVRHHSVVVPLTNISSLQPENSV